jgi:precorrin-3B synthase
MPDLPLRASGDDRCPGALRLHAADDGYVARIRVPGGRLTASRLVALCDLADDLGDGVLHLTSRGNVQVRGLYADSGRAVATRLQDAGLLPSLAHDRVRNVVASPYGGESVDDALAALDAALVADPRLVSLSGRFLFGIDDGSGDVLALDPDLAVTPPPLPLPLPAEPSPLAGRTVTSGGPSWQLLVGVEPTGVHGAPETLLVEAASAFLDVRDEHASTAWRVRELPDAARAALLTRCNAELPSLHTEHTGHSATTAPRQSTAPRQTLTAWVPLGAAPTDTWREVATLADRVILTPRRSVVIPHPHDEETARIALQATGFSLDPNSDTARTTACIGAPGCARSLADVRTDAARLAAENPDRTLHVSGCERRCGHPTGPHLDAVASATGYVIQEH